MKKTVSLILLIAIISGALFLCSCDGKEEKTQKTLYNASFITLFDTVTVIKGYEETQEEFAAVAQEVFSFLEGYHKMFDIYYEYSGINNLCTVNKNAGKPVVVDPEMLDMLDFAIEMHKKSSGKVNIAMGSVLSIWHDYREEGINHPEDAKLPTNEELQAAYEHTDINNIKIDREASTVTLLDDKMRLDVGAVAKGYATELAARFLESKGKTGYILSVGGNVRTVGKKADGGDWRLGVENPFHTDGGDEYVCKINVPGGYSLVTSGNYQRYYTVDGKRYHHIIDPDTLFPRDEYVLVSVLTRDSGVADSLSTALFNMSVEEGKQLLGQLEDAEAVWYYSDGTVVYSDGIEAYLTN